jgi:hypothetical protein
MNACNLFFLGSILSPGSGSATLGITMQKNKIILLNLIFILLRVQTTRGKSLQVLVSGTMEMEGVFSLAEFVTGRAVVTSGHQMVHLEPMGDACTRLLDGWQRMV